MFIPDPNFSITDSDPASKRCCIPDPDPRQSIEVFSTPKIFSKLLEIWSGILISDPDPGSWFVSHTGSWIQGSKRHRIQEDPQHCTKRANLPTKATHIIPVGSTESVYCFVINCCHFGENSLNFYGFLKQKINVSLLRPMKRNYSLLFSIKGKNLMMEAEDSFTFGDVRYGMLLISSCELLLREILWAFKNFKMKKDFFYLFLAG